MSRPRTTAWTILALSPWTVRPRRLASSRRYARSRSGIRFGSSRILVALVEMYDLEKPSSAPMTLAEVPALKALEAGRG